MSRLLSEPADEALIDVLMIATDAGHLLVPNVCVAEVLPWRRPSERPAVPPWYRGELEWRDRRVALVDYALLDAEGEQASSPHGAGACQVVLNRIRPDTPVAFYALVAGALPRLLHLAAEDLERSDDGGAADLMAVQVGTELARIPDLEALEQLVARFAPV